MGNIDKVPDYLKKGRKVGRPKKKRANERQKIFAREYVLTGSVKKAKEAANYSSKSVVNPITTTPAIAEEVEKYRQKIEDKFLKRADEMAEQLYSLILTTESDTVKLNAIRDWLDRAGFQPVNKSEIKSEKVVSAESKISAELINRLNSIKEMERSAQLQEDQDNE